MKASYWYVGLGGLAVLAAAIVVTGPAELRTANAQGVQVETTPDGSVDVDVNRTGERNRRNAVGTDAKGMHGRSCKASELIGLNVRGKTGDDDIGEISDLMIGRDGRIVYAAVSFGGFLGMGDKMFAVPFGAVDMVRDGDDDMYARIDVTEETLEKKEGFDQDHWPEMASKSFRMRATPRAGNRAGNRYEQEINPAR